MKYIDIWVCDIHGKNIKSEHYYINYTILCGQFVSSDNFQ